MRISFISLETGLHISGQLKVLGESLMEIVEQETLFSQITLGRHRRECQSRSLEENYFHLLFEFLGYFETFA